jgi:hypothetical protein
MEFKDLSVPFAQDDIEWRMQQSGLNGTKPWGKCLAYVTNRAIMDRLDSVCGHENWKNLFTAAPVGGILCGISILVDSNEWVTKWDGAQNTDVEAVKGGLSNAMKRAAVQWGIGRYLYNLETGWAVFDKNGKYSAKMKDGSFHKWNPPQLPSWALPVGDTSTPKKEDDFLPEQPPIDYPEGTFLDQMKWYAKHEPVVYKKHLAFWQVDSATKIVDPEAQKNVFSDIEKDLDYNRK